MACAGLLVVTPGHDSLDSWGTLQVPQGGGALKHIPTETMGMVLLSGLC